MKIKEIEIENYKGFENIVINFHPKLNVFIGNNAAGKTTLLLAIIKTFYRMSRHYSGEVKQHEELKLLPTEVNYAHTSALIRLELDQFLDYKKQITLSNAVFPPDSNRNITKIFTTKSVDTEFEQWFNNKTGFPTTIPIFKYYPSNRGAIKFASERQLGILKISQLEAWTNIYQDSISYSKFFYWFLENENLELRLQNEHQDFSIKSPVLDGVRQAVIKSLQHLGYSNLTIKTNQFTRQGSSQLIPVLVLENLTTKQKELLDNKSDGEKAIITLVADIAYNLSLAKDFTSSNNFLNSPGIVLIDEIETHLHPTWQRKVIPILLEIFPNIQFFVATHSPQIVSSVKSESVFVCNNFKVSKITLKTLNEDSNSILKHIFNSTDRPLEYINMIKEFDSLIEQRMDYQKIEKIIEKIIGLDKQDPSSEISNLIGDLKLQLSAYKFDREHEKDN